jgi:hypothetical protein
MRSDERMKMTKLIGAFLDYANAPKKENFDACSLKEIFAFRTNEQTKVVEARAILEQDERQHCTSHGPAPTDYLY